MWQLHKRAEEAMRRKAMMLVVAVFSLLGPALAQEDVADRQLFGSWRLVSFQLKVIGEEGAPTEPFGSHPFGRIILTSGHHMMVFISKSDRTPPSNQAEAAALLSSMTAYTGKFRIAGDKFVTTVDGAWNEFYKGTEQVRFLVLDGSSLKIRTAEQASAILPGKKTVATLVWEREQ
jgi:hypothetical protein